MNIKTSTLRKIIEASARRGADMALASLKLKGAMEREEKLVSERDDGAATAIDAIRETNQQTSAGSAGARTRESSHARSE